MTELEERIYQIAKEVINDELIERVKLSSTEGCNTLVPFLCEGVIDSLVFDQSLGRFTKIKYSLGKGDGLSFGMDNSGYFNECEYKEFDIPD